VEKLRSLLAKQCQVQNLATKAGPFGEANRISKMGVVGSKWDQDLGSGARKSAGTSC
jgi:hypothetical protein